MNISQILKKITNVIKQTEIDTDQIDKIPTFACCTKNLKKISDTEIKEILSNNSANETWKSIVSTLSINLPEMTGGINPGDQQAIFYLIWGLKPNNVLEIGTHIGCSTVYIALALKSQTAKNLITVDIRDVNDTITKPWRKYQSCVSPLEMIIKINAQDYTKFVVSDSLYFFQSNPQKFDFIFLDGSHDAHVVYQEIPMALDHLNENGIVLLHDCFPNGKPLWENYPAITGPYLAVKRLQEEGANLKVYPLGNLPWETKL
jgi:predicted O-methyltransferase YrrM